MIHLARYKELNSAYPRRTQPQREADVRPALTRSPSRASVWIRHIPPLVKVATLLLLGLTLLSVGVLTAARTGAMPHIKVPPQEYLPGSTIYRSYGDTDCNDNQYVAIDMICVVQDMYVYYESGTYRIILTIISTYKYEIGELIVAWGFPIGFHQSGSSVVVSWGDRSAFLDTPSFNPYSRVQSIEYDLDPIERPR